MLEKKRENETEGDRLLPRKAGAALLSLTLIRMHKHTHTHAVFAPCFRWHHPLKLLNRQENTASLQPFTAGQCRGQEDWEDKRRRGNLPFCLCNSFTAVIIFGSLLQGALSQRRSLKGGTGSKDRRKGKSEPLLEVAATVLSTST